MVKGNVQLWATKVMIIIIISISYQLLLSLHGGKRNSLFFVAALFIRFLPQQIPHSFICNNSYFSNFPIHHGAHHLKKSASVKLAVGKIFNSPQIILRTTIRKQNNNKNKIKNIYVCIRINTLPLAHPSWNFNTRLKFTL